MNKACIKLQHNTTSTTTRSSHPIHPLDRYPPKDSPEAVDEKGALLRIRSDLKSALKASNPQPFTLPVIFQDSQAHPTPFHYIQPNMVKRDGEKERERGREIRGLMRGYLILD